MKKQNSWAAILVMGMMISGCAAKVEWPDTELAQRIPSVSQSGEVKSNTPDTLWVELKKQSAKSFSTYVNSCREKGFTLEASQTDSSYEAYDQQGYNLNIHYSDYDHSMTIRLEAPEMLGTLNWPETGLAAELPEPDSDKGKIETDSSTSFRARVSMELSGFEAYVKACQKAGFDQDYEKHEDWYRAYGPDGLKVNIHQSGLDQYLIEIAREESMETEEEKTTDPVDLELPQTEQEPEENEPEKQEMDQEILRPADQKPLEETDENSSQNQPASEKQNSTTFRDTMDAYEDFVDEYILFMQKWQDSEDTSGMISDYMEFSRKYTEYLETIESMNEDSLSSSDWLYYLEVTQRVNRKLADLAQ